MNLALILGGGIRLDCSVYRMGTKVLSVLSPRKTGVMPKSRRPVTVP
jgi:hypothetical protein